MTAQTLGLALIAKDEEDVLPGLLASIEGAFDQVAVVDTGSSDRTVEVFEGWAEAERERQPGFVATLGHFDWCDDFAAARNAADDLLETDWLAWADCDDVIQGAGRLRGVLEEAPPGVDVLTFDYTNGTGDHSVPRRRLTRARFGPRWVGRLHEGMSASVMSAEETSYVHRNVCHWMTLRSGYRESSVRRNRAVLTRWVSEEPGNPVPLRMLAASESILGSSTEGLALVQRYVRLFREPVMTPHEAEMTDWALRWLKECIEDGPEGFVPPGDRWPLQAPLVMALDCRPIGFEASGPIGFEASGYVTSGVVATPELATTQAAGDRPAS